MSQATTFAAAYAEICAREGPLAQRLADLSAILRTFDPPSAEAYEELVRTLQAAEAGMKAPNVGDPLPRFMLPDHEGHLARLDRMLASGPLVVSFNRGHWCEFCDLELRSFAAAHAEIAGRGARVVCILPERQEYARQVAERAANTILVLCDMDNSYALELDLVVWVGERVREIMSGHGLDLERFQGNGMWFVPIPATFVVARDGVIAARFVDPDFRRRMEIDAILAALDRCTTG